MGVGGNAGAFQQLLPLFRRGDVTPDAVGKLGFPVPTHGAGNVPGVVRGRVDVHLDQANVVVVAVGGDPIGVDEDIWIHIFGH